MNQSSKPIVAVGFDLGPQAREKIEGILTPVAQVEHLQGMNAEKRALVLRKAKALLAWAPHKEFSDAEQQQLGSDVLLQLLSAGVDHLDFARIPAGLRVASNVGGYARPMAEHTLALVLALAKRLFAHHEQLKQGVQRTRLYLAQLPRFSAMGESAGKRPGCSRHSASVSWRSTVAAKARSLRIFSARLTAWMMCFPRPTSSSSRCP